MVGYKVDRQSQIQNTTSSRDKTLAYNTLSAMELMDRVAVDQDKKAFACLFDIFAPRVKSFMLQKISSIEHAESLVQQAMIEVWRTAKTYSSDLASVATWIFTISRNIRLESERAGCDWALLDFVGDDAELENVNTNKFRDRLQ